MMTSRTWIKICGLRRQQDAELAAELGADALGMIFVEKSARAGKICKSECGLAWRVGLFLNPERTLVEQVLSEVELDILQFHGSETAGFCESFRVPYIKALSWGNLNQRQPFAEQVTKYPQARGYIIDSHTQDGLGGTGQSYDWERFPRHRRRPLILAGGLRADNVASAIELARPYGVDVSSGIEISPGVKDPELMREFFKEVQGVDIGRTNK